jgi:hypothetical protein
MLDPNRPTVTKWAIAYMDSNNNLKYAIQGLHSGGTQLNGFTSYFADKTADVGGYVSLAFYDTHSDDTKRFAPAISYYDSHNTALRYTVSTDGGHGWKNSIVASSNVQGLYTSLFMDSENRPNIFYYDLTDNRPMRAVLSSGKWKQSSLGVTGGREMHVDVNSHGTIAYTNLDETVGRMTVSYIIA